MLHDALRMLPNRRRMVLLNDLRRILDQHDGGQRIKRYPSLTAPFLTFSGSSFETDKLLQTQPSLLSTQTTDLSSPPNRELPPPPAVPAITEGPNNDVDETSDVSSKEDVRSENAWNDEDEAAWEDFWNCVIAGDLNWMCKYLDAEAATELMQKVQKTEDPMTENALGTSVQLGRDMQLSFSRSFRMAPGTAGSSLCSTPRSVVMMDTLAASRLVHDATSAVLPSAIVEANNAICEHCGARALSGVQQICAPYEGIVGPDAPPPQNVPPNLLSTLDAAMWKYATQLLQDGAPARVEQRVEMLKCKLKALSGVPSWITAFADMDKAIHTARSLANSKRHAAQKKINCALRELKAVKEHVINQRHKLDQLPDRERQEALKRFEITRELIAIEARADECNAQLSEIAEEDSKNSCEDEAVASVHGATNRLHTELGKWVNRIHSFLEPQAPRAIREIKESLPLKLDLDLKQDELKLKGMSDSEARRMIFGDVCPSCSMLAGYSLCCPVTGSRHPSSTLHEIAASWDSEHIVCKPALKRSSGGGDHLSNSTNLGRPISSESSLSGSEFTALKRANTLQHETIAREVLLERHRSSGSFNFRSAKHLEVLARRRGSTGSKVVSSDSALGSDVDELLESRGTQSLEFNLRSPNNRERGNGKRSLTRKGPQLPSKGSSRKELPGTAAEVPTPREADLHLAANISTFVECLNKMVRHEHITADVELAPNYVIQALIINQLTRRVMAPRMSPASTPRATPLPPPKTPTRQRRRSPKPPAATARSHPINTLAPQEVEVKQLKKSIASLNQVLRFASIPVKELLKKVNELEVAISRHVARLKEIKDELSADQATLAAATPPEVYLAIPAHHSTPQPTQIFAEPPIESEGQAKVRRQSPEELVSTFVSGVGMHVGAWHITS